MPVHVSSQHTFPPKHDISDLKLYSGGHLDIQSNIHVFGDGEGKDFVGTGLLQHTNAGSPQAPTFETTSHPSLGTHP